MSHRDTGSGSAPRVPPNGDIHYPSETYMVSTSVQICMYQMPLGALVYRGSGSA